MKLYLCSDPACPLHGHMKVTAILFHPCKVMLWCRGRTVSSGGGLQGWQVCPFWTFMITRWEHIFLVLPNSQIPANLFPLTASMCFLLKNISLWKPLTKFPNTKEWVGHGTAEFPQSGESAGGGKNVITATPCGKIKGPSFTSKFPFVLNEMTVWNTQPTAERVTSCWAWIIWELSIRSQKAIRGFKESQAERAHSGHGGRHTRKWWLVDMHGHLLHLILAKDQTQISTFPCSSYVNQKDGELKGGGDLRANWKGWPAPGLWEILWLTRWNKQHCKVKEKLELHFCLHTDDDISLKPQIISGSPKNCNLKSHLQDGHTT